MQYHNLYLCLETTAAKFILSHLPIKSQKTPLLLRIFCMECIAVVFRVLDQFRQLFWKLIPAGRMATPVAGPMA